MAILNVVEYRGNVTTFTGGLAPQEPNVGMQNVAIGAASAQSTAFTEVTKLVRITADEPCYIEFGANPTAAVGDIYIPAGVPQYFGVNPTSKVAVIQD